ncbi:MAG: DUF2249 domain-containing protein [Burkholderiales bacterium]
MSETIAMPLDLRGTPASTAEQLVLNKAKFLQQGKSFQMLTDHDPKGLLQLLKGLGDDFSGEYRESGPAMWRVQVSKRAAETSNCCSGGACCG